MLVNKDTLIDAVGATAFGIFMLGMARAGLNMMVDLTTTGATLLDVATIGGIVAIPVTVIKNNKEFHFLEENKTPVQDWAQMPRDCGAPRIEDEEEEIADVDALLPDIKTTDEVVPVAATAVLVNQEHVQQVSRQTQEQPIQTAPLTAAPTPSTQPLAPVPSPSTQPLAEQQQATVDEEWEALFATAEAMSEDDSSADSSYDEYLSDADMMAFDEEGVA